MTKISVSFESFKRVAKGLFDNNILNVKKNDKTTFRTN